MPDNSSSIAILGAGITGLSVAHALKKRGVPAVVYEKKEQPGGMIQTHSESGWLVEKGPNTMLVRDRRIWELLDELELTDRIAKPGTEAKKRYIVRGSTLCPAPMTITDFLKTDLLSTGAKFRLLKEPFVSAPDKQQDDESIASFIRRRLGPEPLDYGVNPFVSGIYAGDPEALSAKHTFSSLYEMERNHGSISRGFLNRENSENAAKRALLSFDEGLGLLPRAMGRHLRDTLQCGVHISSMKKRNEGWELSMQHNGDTVKKNHQKIVTTLPVHQLLAVWNGAASANRINELAKIEYAPMSMLALGFRREQVSHPLDGFGMLIPEKEPFSLLGCLFSSSLFKCRAPEGRVLLTCFIGGARHPGLALEPTESLIAEAKPQLRDLLDVQGDPVFHHHTYWPRAIPQYTVGYDQFLETMRQIEDDNPGLYMAGNYRGGVSVPDCILNGFEMAERL